MMLAPAFGTDEQQPVLRVSTKYMETFQPQQPVSGGSDISAYLNERGELDLYSVGSSNEVHRIRLDSGGRASYSARSLGIRAQQLSLYSGLEQSADNPNIFGINDEGKLTLSVYDPATGRYDQKVTQPPNATAKLRNFLAVKGYSNVYANVILDDGRLATNFYKPDGTWGGPNWVPIKDQAGKDVKAIAIAMCANNPVQTALFAIAENNELLFGEESFRYSTMKPLAKKVLNVAVVVDRADLLHIFAVDMNHRLWLKRQKKYSSGPGIEFEDWVQLNKSVALDRVYATLRSDGLLEVYAIGSEGSLYRTYQTVDAKGKPTGWADLFPLGNPIGNSIFTVGRDRKGFAQVFSVTHDGRIFQFWQSEETTQWLNQEIHDTEMAKLASTPTHAVEITVLDNAGIPQPDTEISIASSYLANLRINGLSYRSSPADRVKCRTDAAGKVVVYQQAVALGGATLFVETPFTLAGQPAEVEPNGQLQAKLHAITEEDVLKATDRKGNYLLPAEFRKPENARSIAEITRGSMALGLQGQSVGAIRLHYRAGLRGRSQPGRRLDFARVAKDNWKIDFVDGFPQYQAMSAPAAAAWVQARRDQGLEFLGVDWGDVWNAIKEGFGAIVDGLKSIAVWIDEAAQKVSVFFHVVIDGIEKVFDTVLEYVQQAFDFIEGVWNYIKVGLEKLYEWLSFLFNFEDFKRTAEAVEHTFNVLLDYTVLATKYARKQIDDGIQGLKDELESAVDEFLKTLQSAPTFGNYGDQYKKPNPDLEESSDHNLFLNAFLENGRDTKVTRGMAAKLADPLKIIAEKFEELGKNFEFGDGKKAFDDALGYFTNVGGDKNNALTLLVSGFVKLFEAIALFVLDAARAAILTVLDLIADVIEAFKALMNEEWEIPIVSQLYELFTGDKLSFRPISLLAYFLGIPATLFYKVLTGETMFTESSLKEFKETFTAGWLAQQSGIAPQPHLATLAPRQLSAAQQDQLAYYFKTFYATTVTARLVTDTAQAIFNASNPESWRGLNIACVGLRYLTTGFGTPWALSSDAGSFACPAGAKGFSNITWLCQILFGPTRGVVCIAAAPFLKTAAKPTAEVTLSLWGAAHVIMDTVDFAMQPAIERNPQAFAAKVLLNVPGQCLRFLALDKLNPPQTFYIPVGVLVVTIIVGYGGSILLTAPMSMDAPSQQ